MIEYINDIDVFDPPQVHGELRCHSDNRFMCMICWTSVCWCFGCASVADEVIGQNRKGRSDNEDAGICNLCSCVFSVDKGVIVTSQFAEFEVI